MYYHGKMVFFETLLELSDYLMEHFYEIKIIHVQCQISGAGLGGFYHILCEYFQPGCLGFQNIQIFQNLRICKILTFQKINVADNGSQRGLQIVGNVGDQLGFHSLIFHTVFYSCVKTASNVINIFCNMFIIAPKPFQRNFILQVSIGNFSQSFYNLFSAAGFCNNI